MFSTYASSLPLVFLDSLSTLFHPALLEAHSNVLPWPLLFIWVLAHGRHWHELGRQKGSQAGIWIPSRLPQLGCGPPLKAVSLVRLYSLHSHPLQTDECFLHWPLHTRDAITFGVLYHSLLCVLNPAHTFMNVSLLSHSVWIFLLFPARMLIDIWSICWQFQDGLSFSNIRLLYAAASSPSLLCPNLNSVFYFQTCPTYSFHHLIDDNSTFPTALTKHLDSFTSLQHLI